MTRIVKRTDNPSRWPRAPADRMFMLGMDELIVGLATLFLLVSCGLIVLIEWS